MKLTSFTFSTAFIATLAITIALLPAKIAALAPPAMDETQAAVADNQNEGEEYNVSSYETNSMDPGMTHPMPTLCYCAYCGMPDPYQRGHIKGRSQRMRCPGEMRAASRQMRGRPHRPDRMDFRKGRGIHRPMKGRGPGIAAERVLRHAANLELTETQISQLEELAFDTRKQLIDLRADMQKERLELRKCIQTDSDDLTEIKAHMNTLAKKRVDIQELKLMNWIAVKKILTEDQKKKILEQLPRMGMMFD